MQNDELKHFGIPGMKWGKRKVRGHAGPGRYTTRKRQLAGDKRDLKDLEKGKHLSVGFTKKRQARFDERDKKALEKRIAKNENHVKENQAKKALKQQQKQAKRQQEYEKLVKDNDARVKMYGKNAVRAGDVLSIAITAQGMHYGNKLIKDIGTSVVQKLADDPNVGNAALHIASALTVAGMGAVTVSSLKRINALGRDIHMTNEYDYRKYVKEQNKAKK